MTRLYDDNMYRFEQAQPSYWEATRCDTQLDASPLPGDESCDVAIIGGGYTGLSAAMHLARDYDVDVRVLEAGHIGWGASGRNGGFCGLGGTGVHGSDLVARCGEQDARAWYRAQCEAVELVRHIAIDEHIDVQAIGDAEVQVAHTQRAYAALQEDHDLYSRVLGVDTQLVTRNEFSERYYDSTEQHGALLMRPNFGLHPLRYCRGLAAAAARHGATLHERSEVLEWLRDDTGRHRLVTAGGTISARRVLFATNGFMPESLRPDFSGRTLPIISAIVVTEPLSHEQKAAHSWGSPHCTINTRRVMNYYRLLPDDRLLFGGRGHTAGHVAGERRNYEKLVAVMRRIWPEWSDVGIDYRWHGLICFNASMYPSLGHLADDNSVFYGFGYHGNGVNTATWAGKKLAEWMATGSPQGLPVIARGLGRRFPLARLRLRYLQLALAARQWLDRLDRG